MHTTECSLTSPVSWAKQAMQLHNIFNFSPGIKFIEQKLHASIQLLFSSNGYKLYCFPTQVNTGTLNLDHASIQITHVEPYFTSKELEERKSKFERENNISRFMFETPFTQDGKTHGDVTKQCMRKTILTSETIIV